MTPREQMRALMAVSTPVRRTTVRQVAGGYLITAATSFKASDGSEAVLAEHSMDAVAANAEDATQMVGNFLMGGSFYDIILDDPDADQLVLPIAQEPGAITAAEAPKPTVI